MSISIPKSAIDMGDPSKNLFNKDFWGWHGVLDGAFQRYLKWYATDAQRASFAQLQKDEGERMDASTPTGKRVKDALRAIEMATPEEKKILERIHWKTFPIATPA